MNNDTARFITTIQNELRQQPDTPHKQAVSGYLRVVEACNANGLNHALLVALATEPEQEKAT
jgi:hypothetical protein